MIDLVLVHAFPLDGRMWAGQARALADVAHVHAPDLPGFGASTKPPVEAVEAMADAIRSYVDDRRLTRFVLGGLSMGGYVTLAYWRRHARQRRPAGLVLCDTRVEADGPEARRARDEVARTVLAEKSLAPYADRMLPHLLASGAPEEAVARARELIEAQSPATVAAGARALRDRPNFTALLGGIDVPALVVCGEKDELTPPGPMRLLAAKLPDAELALLAGAGHLSNLERPAAFDEALRRFAARF